MHIKLRKAKELYTKSVLTYEILDRKPPFKMESKKAT
jgi:hypothetical protein